MTRGQKTWRVLAAAVLVAAGIQGDLYALRVDPGRQEMRVRPGSSRSSHIQVVNDSQEPVSVEVSSKDWFTLPENREFDVETWLKFHGARKFTLQPGEERKVKVTVKAPRKARGELVGMVSFLYRSPNVTMITPIISVSVYALLEGTEQLAGEITDITLRYWEDRLQAAVSVRATGNAHLRPTGKVTVMHEGGQEVVTLPVGEAGPTYPGRVQAYFGSDPSKLGPGKYMAKAEMAARGVLMEATQDFEVTEDGKIKMGSR